MLTQEDIILCRKDFGFFAFQVMLRVFNIRLNLKREDGSKNYLWMLFSSINRWCLKKHTVNGGTYHQGALRQHWVLYFM
ncbi:hypothetical protein [Wolbachia endosymbiont (group A) of Conops quadrifasciatus]|uniref:hypothetical protein n=1 Tax=Wolbachia endosymbiont (group A) of Conops quadrifasciatus TaxID=3066143 RepID=UPI003132D117